MTDKELEEAELPPRSRLHSTDGRKWSRRFYGFLVGVFTSLIVILIVLKYLEGM
ncbi:hypothetical protein [Paenibacillus sp. YN15]|uniref:hypothetical protein n=1 Tax=Paenibacillus sp. YN15 TaxID=1742774 RepID=UPI0015EC5AB7|nr:hypothetical protein [Paenibacillus sp. YN15]